MPRVFKLTPKRIKRVNGLVLTPSMEVVVTTSSSSPFNNGAKEVKEVYMRMYGLDLNKLHVQSSDFHIAEDR